MAPLSVIVPLYIYPLENAWEPLFRAARAHPFIRFLAIVNPNNGPGSASRPDASYQAVLRQLSTVPNIQPIGYVHCSYGQREAAEVRRDIDTYLDWNRDFRLEGIFIDEAPSDVKLVPYVASLARHVHSNWPSTTGHRGTAIYNPGVAVDRSFFADADYVVTFEQSHDHWRLLHSAAAASQLPLDLYPKALAIIHSFVTTREELDMFVEQMRAIGYAGLYITEQMGGGFTHWPAAWDRLVQALET